MKNNFAGYEWQGERMAETQVKPQRYTTAAVPLCREHLHQPALCDLLFPSRAYPLPKVVPGHEALIYDADAWDVWNGRRGIVTHYSYFTGLHTMHVEGIWQLDFYGREIMKGRR